MAVGGAGGAGNLGSAIFTIAANTTQFVQGMQQAQAQAQSAANAIQASLNGLANLPRQLAAINREVINSTNAIYNLAAQMQKMRGFGGGGGGAGAGSPFGGWGMALASLGQMVDDIQYGFQAIVNNIQQFATQVGGALGMSTQQAAGFGAAIGIVGVAINQLSKHWDQLFGDSDKLPRIKEGVDGLTESLKRLKEEIAPLQKAQDEVTEGRRGWFGAMTDTMGFGEGGFVARDRLRKLKKLEGETKERLRDEKAVEATGEEHTDEREKTAKAVKEAIANLPRGSDSLHELLMSGGMSKDQATKTIGEASRGHAGYLDDIIKALPGHLAADFKAATPQERERMEQLRLEAKGNKNSRKWQAKKEKEHEKGFKEFAEGQWSDDERKKKQDKAYMEKFAQFQQGQEADDKRDKQKSEDRAQAERERVRKAEHEGKVRRRVRELWNDPFKATHQEAQWGDVGEFWKKMQTGTLNNHDRLQKEANERLKQIVEILNDNKMNAMVVKGQLAIGPPA